MKKKGLLLSLGLLFIFILSSCSILSENEDTDYGLDESTQTTQIVSSLEEAYLKVSSGCVGIKNEVKADTIRIGSGVVLKTTASETYILTNRHVVEAEDLSKINSKVYAYFGNGYYVSASVIAATSYADRISNQALDLALLKISTPPSQNIKPVTIGDDIVRKGQTVFSVGCPITLEFFNTLTSGVVEKVLTSQNLVQHQATINPGNSGGGLFNMAGRLIGLNVSKININGTELIEDMGFAIDIAQIRSFLSTQNFKF